MTKEMNEENNLKEENLKEENLKEENLKEEPVEETTEKEELEETKEVSESDEKEAALEKLQADFSEMEDKFLRAQAEIANMTRRNRQERELLQRYRSQDLAKGILGSLDNLERALATEVSDEQGESLKKGVAMVLEGLIHALGEEGVKEIPAMGEVFDPNLHQAVQTIPAGEDYKADTIVEVLQKGYELHDRVLRPAMVIVAQ